MTNYNDDHLSYVQDFFLSWGLDVDNEDSYISGEVYSRMMDVVKDGCLKETIIRVVNAVDNQFYLAPDNWGEIEEVYQENVDYKHYLQDLQSN